MLIVGGVDPNTATTIHIANQNKTSGKIKHKYGIHTNRENKKNEHTHIQTYLQNEEINQILSDQYQKTRTEGRG